MFRLGEAEKRLPVLRQSVGPIHFANADWAHGWRGYIDGAVEQGIDSCTKVRKQLRGESGVLRASI
jgi:monoamine oxidase